MKRYCNAKITITASTWNKSAQNTIKRIVKALNKPGWLRTKAHLRRGKWLTISTDVATPRSNGTIHQPL